MKASKVIKVDYLSRVEGEGALYINIKRGRVKDVKFKIFEPPRFFEAFLRGRNFKEAVDITARICGICPIAYQISAVNALEDVCNFRPNQALHNLRRLIYCGEWIESHMLHILLLHAPDFLGYPDGLTIAKKYPQLAKKGLELKKLGNEIVTLLGGREIHPINVKVGGFYRLPSQEELIKLAQKIKNIKSYAKDILNWVSSFKFPSFEQDYEFVSLSYPGEYPLNRGRIISNKGIDIEVKDYENYFQEKYVPYTNALMSYIKDRGSYMVGSLARINFNFHNLPSSIKKLASSVGFKVPCFNPFKSIIARTLEVAYALEEALRIIDWWCSQNRVKVNTKEVVPQEGVGYGISEAPRGILYHRYRINKKGDILEAKIIPPTSQNQKRIEDDLDSFVRQYIHKDKETLRAKCEKAVRNYDPCISCATHFLKIKIEKE